MSKTNRHSVTLCMSALEAFFHTNTQKSWGWSFVMWRGIFSHAPYAEGPDLRHSSENLCPNSCGPIRLCVDLEENAVHEIMKGIQSITHLQSTPSAHICTCKPFSVRLCTSLSMCNSERFPAFTVYLQLLNSYCVCECLCETMHVHVHTHVCVKDSEMVLHSALWWLNSYPWALCIGRPWFKGEKPWFHIAATWKKKKRGSTPEVNTGPQREMRSSHRHRVRNTVTSS